MEKNKKHNFFETGKVKDYLDYKNRDLKNQHSCEFSKEIILEAGEKNGVKRRNSCKNN